MNTIVQEMNNPVNAPGGMRASVVGGRISVLGVGPKKSIRFTKIES